MPTKTLYHGTSIFFRPPFNNKPTWFANNYEYALQHAALHKDGSVMVIKAEMDLDKIKLFDPRKQGHRDMLRDILPKIMHLKIYDDMPIRMHRLFLLRQLELFTNDVWRYLETGLIMSRIKELGFDGHISQEDHDETYCIYHPSKAVQVVGYLQEMKWEQFNSYYK